MGRFELAMKMKNEAKMSFIVAVDLVFSRKRVIETNSISGIIDMTSYNVIPRHNTLFSKPIFLLYIENVLR